MKSLWYCNPQYKLKTNIAKTKIEKEGLENVLATRLLKSLKKVYCVLDAIFWFFKLIEIRDGTSNNLVPRQNKIKVMICICLT